MEAAVAATRKYGAGSGAVRTISGTMSIYMELERRIAQFKHPKRAWCSNPALRRMPAPFPRFSTPEDHIISDALESREHYRRLPAVECEDPCVPRIADMAAAGRILDDLAGASGRKLLITDGVFSMDGDIGPLPGLVAPAESHGAIMMIDDAHSSGVLGRNGRGTVDHFGPARQSRHSSGYVVESYWRAGRLCVRQPRFDRVSLSSRAAIPVFDFASARGRRRPVWQLSRS